MNINNIEINKNEFDLYQMVINKLNNKFLSIDIKNKNGNRKNKSIIYLNVNTKIEDIKLMLSDTNILLYFSRFNLLNKLKPNLQIFTVCMIREFFWNKYKLGLFKDNLISKDYYKNNLQNHKNEKIIFIENIFKCMEFHLKNSNDFNYQKLENSINFKQLKNYFKDFILKKEDKQLIKLFLRFKENSDLKINIKLEEFNKLTKEIQKEKLLEYSIKAFKLMLQDIQNYQNFSFIDIVPDSEWEDISKLNKKYFQISFKDMFLFNIKNINNGEKSNLSDIDTILINCILNIYLSKNIDIKNINKNKSIFGTNDENITIALQTEKINYAQELMALYLAKKDNYIQQKDINDFIKNIEYFKTKNVIIENKLYDNSIYKITEEEIEQETKLKYEENISKNKTIENINTDENFNKIEKLIEFISNFKNIQNLLNEINEDKNIDLLKNINSIKNLPTEFENKIKEFINLCRENFKLRFHSVQFISIGNSLIQPPFNEKDKTIHNLVTNLYTSATIIEGNQELKILQKYLYKINKDKFYFKINESYFNYLKSILPIKLSSIFEIENQSGNKLKISIKRNSKPPGP